MLSSPFSSTLLSLATNSENSSSKIAPRAFLPTRLFSQPIISPLLFAYQIPSHPIIRKSKLSFFIFVIYGLAVIICYYTGKFLADLYSKSPIALDKFRLPLILPSSTSPPALTIRSFSGLSSGLWSRLSSLASPFKLQTTARESPTLGHGYLNGWRFTGICDVDIVRSYETDVGSTASMRLLIKIRSVFLLPHLLLNFGNFMFPLITHHHLVHFEEGLLQSQLIIFSHVILIHLQLLYEVPADVDGYFCSCVGKGVPPCPSKMPKR